jgi:hypothetical protein
LLCALAPVAAAQDPSRDYLTIATPHFRVSFTRELEGVARRVAGDAERAYAQLSAALHPPRGTIDVLVTDDFDFANGSAVTSPTNRIIVYAMPPVNDFGLRYTTDWAQMVVTHELTHIFHLDRARGIWRIGQAIFGRSPFLFPNVYQPSWLIEGLAVYEESRLAGQGRVEGPEHAMLARAAAMDHVFPRIGEASLALPRFPGGTSAYAFGSLFVDYLARTHGDTAVRRFVESSSAQLIPYLVDLPARRAFGTRFGPAWQEWQRSIGAADADSTEPARAWKDLTGDMLALDFPRWLDDRTLIYTATTGREILSAYTATTDGEISRLGRRNGASPTTRLPDGSLLFSQFEYIGPYVYRSDLYVQRPGGRPARMTTGQRLFTPDARADGEIIAMQAIAGATRVVRVARSGTVTAITSAGPDTLWSEPRWSHRGDRIVATRWIRGGVAQIVIIDTLGAQGSIVATGRNLLASPSWTANDAGIVYSAGDARSNDAWITLVDSARSFRLTRAAAALVSPEPHGRTLAGLTLHGRGYRLGAGELAVQSFRDSLPRTAAPDPRLPALAVDSSPVRAYSALRQMTPRYWVPLAEEIRGGAWALGGYTEAWDILRRHYLYGELRIPTNNSGLSIAGEYQYRGLGRPILTFSGSQDWTTPYATVVSRSDPGQALGTIRRRIRDGDILATTMRQRVRSSASLSFGAGVERRDYLGDPASVLAMVDSGGFFRAATFPRLTLSSTYARYLSPPFAISPEDGFTVAVTARERLRSSFNATGNASTSVVGALALYKSLDLPGYAHHVLGARVSAGWADTKTNTQFEVGGVSGGSFQVFPGYNVGEGRRTFPVRGFPAGAVQGIRAVSGSIEYRAPLSLGHLTLGTLPGFLQRSALTVFGDYASAWCPNTVTTRQVCFDPAREARATIGSLGAELSMSAGLLSWDSPTRLRLGVAHPVHDGAALASRSLTLYFTSGISF